MLRPLVVLLLSAGMLAPLSASAADPGEGVLLLHLAVGADARDVAARAGATLELELFDVALVSASRHSAERLARDASVLSMEKDAMVRAAASSWDGATWDGASWDGATWDGASEPGPAAPWGLFAIHAPDAWRMPAPAHARLVCVVDSGMDAAHPALVPNVWTGPSGEHGFDAIGGGDDVTDVGGHGTHLAGIVAAARSQPWAGVSEARVAAARALAADGTGRTSDVIAAIAWCDHKNADIILLALTEDAPTRAFRAAIAAAQRGGALIVAAAGNAGPCERCVGSPADLPGVIAVGASGPTGSPADFSSAGPKLDVLAPGVRIASTVPGAGIRVGSGTSQAAAFVAGAAAFAWSACPEWTPNELAHALAPPGRGVPLLDLSNARISSCHGA